MIKVAKFGGTSVASAKTFKMIKDIVLKDERRKVVVVSAPGKREKDDSKVTDLLYLLNAHINYGVDYSGIFNLIKERYIAIRNDLGVEIDLESEFDEIENNVKKGFGEEYLVSRGEYLCAKLMAAYLGFEFVDAEKLFFFDYYGRIDEKKTDSAISAVKVGKGIVVPGFYGVYPNGLVKLFSRGGSDITGALLARGLNASLYENWTDVSGIMMTDPRIVDNPKRIEEITYEELHELSYMGAKVLHEETVFPIKELNIPIRILNTMRPEDEGTLITSDCSSTGELVTGIAGKKDFVSITVDCMRGYKKLQVLNETLAVLRKFRVDVEHITTSIDTFSLITEKSQVDKRLYEMISDIQSLECVRKVSFDDDIALMAVVGRNMVLKPGVSGKIFAVFGEENINIKVIVQGSQELAIIVGVSNKDLNRSIKAVYKKFA
ncbi:MAG: aspartate kinase [Clostridia bacterium]|nr:aspartate kinase [Clostridia bacterium]